jgi:hypothetical protein
MPVRKGYKKNYYRWGNGPKYYFNPNSQTSIDDAYNKALKFGYYIMSKYIDGR